MYLIHLTIFRSRDKPLNRMSCHSSLKYPFVVGLISLSNVVFGADAPPTDQSLITIYQSLPFCRSPVRGEFIRGLRPSYQLIANRYSPLAIRRRSVGAPLGANLFAADAAPTIRGLRPSYQSVQQDFQILVNGSIYGKLHGSLKPCLAVGREIGIVQCLQNRLRQRFMVTDRD